MIRTMEVEELTVGDALRRAAAQSPGGVALVEGLSPEGPRRRWTYAQLLAESETAARAMLTLAQPGERVAVWAHNVPEWILVQMGAALAGMTLVTVNPALSQEEVRHILHNSGAEVVFHVDEYRGRDFTQCLRRLAPELPNLRSTVRMTDWAAFCSLADSGRALPEVTPDDIAQIQYTSGTTGFPKGVRLHHRGLVNNARLTFTDRLPGIHDAPIVNPMPLFHTAGSVVVTLGAIQTRCTHILMPTFNPEVQLRLVESEGSVLLVGVATMLRAMLGHEAFDRTDFSSVQLAVSGGAFVEPPLAREVEERVGVPLIINYGQTECSPGITMTSAEDSENVRTTTVGQPLPGVEVMVADPGDRSRAAGTGEVGEVCTRGYHVMVGYHGEPEATAATVDAEGWLHTGDLGSLDAEGNLRIVGRIKDMIIRGGENIYPAEVETTLLGHEDVAEVAVVGVPHTHWGEEVAAFVRLHNGPPAPEELHAYLSSRMARHKVPRHWYFVDELPLTASGKVIKTELRRKAQQESGQQVASAHGHVDCSS